MSQASAILKPFATGFASSFFVFVLLVSRSARSGREVSRTMLINFRWMEVKAVQIGLPQGMIKPRDLQAVSFVGFMYGVHQSVKIRTIMNDHSTLGLRKRSMIDPWTFAQAPTAIMVSLSRLGEAISQTITIFSKARSRSSSSAQASLASRSSPQCATGLLYPFSLLVQRTTRFPRF